MNQFKLLPLVFAIVFLAIQWSGPSRPSAFEASNANDPVLFSDGANDDRAVTNDEPAHSDQVERLSLAVEVLYSRQYYRTATEVVASIQPIELRDEVIHLAFRRIANDLGIPRDMPLESGRIESPFNQHGELTQFLVGMKDQVDDPGIGNLLDIRLGQYFDKLADLGGISVASPITNEKVSGQSAEEVASAAVVENVLDRIKSAALDLQLEPDPRSSVWSGTFQLMKTALTAALITLGGVLVTLVARLISVLAKRLSQGRLRDNEVVAVQSR